MALLPTYRLFALLSLLAVTSCVCDMDSLQMVRGDIAGVVCATDTGNPSLDTAVSLQQEGVSALTARTDEDGQFGIRNAIAQEGTLCIHDSPEPRCVEVEVPAQEVLVFVDQACRGLAVEEKGHLEGTICNRHIAAYVAQAEVRIDFPSGQFLTTRTDDNGAFTLRDIPVGRHTVKVLAQGFSRSFLVDILQDQTTQLDGQTAACEQVQNTAGRLSGTFCDPLDNGPLFAADVAVRDADAEIHHTRTDDEGHFVVGPLAVGTATVTVTREPDLAFQLDILIVAGQEVHIDGGTCEQVVQQQGDLAGRFCHPSDDGVLAGATVVVTDAAAADHATTTDSDGAFELSGLASGSAQMVVTLAPDVRIEQNIVIVADTQVFVGQAGACESAGEYGGIRGELCDPDLGTPLANTAVQVSDAEGNQHSGITNAGGVVSIDQISVGTAQVTAVASSQTLNFAVEVSAGQVAAFGNSQACFQLNCSQRDFPAPSQGTTGHNMLLVLDRSGSMSFYSSSYQATPWQVVRQAVHTLALDLENDVELALMLFPEYGNATCAPGSMEIFPALGNASDIWNKMNESVWDPSGATPTAASLDVAHLFLSWWESSNDWSVVVATDGGPNCNSALDSYTCTCTATDDPRYCYEEHEPMACLDHTRTVSAVQALHQDYQAPVYVIGVPGAEGYASTLQAMAQAGGTDHYYEGYDVAALLRALGEIGQQVRGCQFDLGTSPGSPDTLEVTLDGAALLRDNNHDHGYDIDGSQLSLYGDACDHWQLAQQGLAVEWCERS